MRASKFFIILLVVLMIIVVLAVAALLFVDPAVFRGQLQARASVALGRQVQFNGPIRLERSLRPRIIVEDITIGNPQWASGAHFARVEEVGVQVALVHLLQGDLRVLDVAFSGVNLFIEEGPGGLNNYTFGDTGESETRGVLPAVERLLVRDVTINYQAADGRASAYKIAEARLWNLPGEPERIEGNGFAKGMPFSILLAADTASELSGRKNPWSLKLNLEGPDMEMVLTGKMVRAFYWDRGDYRITISGQQVDSLESLFDVEFPTTGPFELSWDLNLDGNSFRVTDLEASVQGPPGTPQFQVSHGEVSGGQDPPIQLAFQGKYGDIPFQVSSALILDEKSFQVAELSASTQGPSGSPQIQVSQGKVSAGLNTPLHLTFQGQYDDMPFSFTFKSTDPFEDLSQTTPTPIEAQLSVADTDLNIQGTVIPETVFERFELEAQIEGKTLQTLARMLDAELPETGPFQLSFHTQYAERDYTISNLKGTLNGIEPWKTIRITRGKVSVLDRGSIRASLDARLDKIPLSVSLQGGPGSSGDGGTKTWPLNFTASSTGVSFKADGAVIAAEQQNMLQMATRLSGKRFESLGPLLDTSLPALGEFNLSADLSSDGHIHEAQNLKIKLGTSRLSGSLRWEEKAPRPFLTGRLSSERLALGKSTGAAPKSSPKTAKSDVLDRPIRLEWLKDFDANLDLNVKHIADTPISVADISSTVSLSNGNLSAPFRAKVADSDVDGRIQVKQTQKLPAVSLKTTIGQIDIGQTLRQLDIPDVIGGSAQVIHLDGSTAGRTLREMGRQADFRLQISPANLTYSTRIIDRTIGLVVQSAELSADKGEPLTGALSGLLQGVAYNATFSTANLAELQSTDAALPVRLALQTADVQFQAESIFTKPIKISDFELNYELTGKSIEELSRLADYVFPLRGAFRAQGRITARGNRLSYIEDLRVGKSDLQVDITVLRNPTGPQINGSILASKIHLEDVELFDVDKYATSTSDKTRVIPDYTFPVDILRMIDLDLDIKIMQVEAGSGILSEFGNLASRVNLKDGRFQSTIDATGFSGGRLNAEFELNAAVDPPLNKVLFSAKDIDVGLLLKIMGGTELLNGQLNLYIDLSGPGYTRRKFLGNADGRIVVVGGPGTISSRMVDLWAADLLTTMLSPSWQRQEVTRMNCMAMHVELQEGRAEVDDILLDTERITVAGSGVLDLETEAINVMIAPRPKRASLVSLANPVRIEGTLSEPRVSVTRLPRKRRLLGGGAGIFAGLVNPGFLLLTFADAGTGGANPCDAAIERAYEIIEAEEQ
jgi:uncharacterized protein involved in outer membrane biogenesis